MQETERKPLEAVFLAQVLRMLKKNEKITDEIVINHVSWRHSLTLPCVALIIASSL